MNRSTSHHPDERPAIAGRIRPAIAGRIRPAVDHQVEERAADERDAEALANFFRAVLVGGVATHAQCNGGVRPKPATRRK